MIQLALHEDKYLEACKAYQEVWDTEEVKADPEKEKEVSIDQQHLKAIRNPYTRVLRRLSRTSSCSLSLHLTTMSSTTC